MTMEEAPKAAIIASVGTRVSGLGSRVERKDKSRMLEYG